MSIAEEVLQEHLRDISSITPSKYLVNLIHLLSLRAGHHVRAGFLSGAEVPSRSAGPAEAGSERSGEP